MRISARNVIKGRIVEVVKGATTAHVKLDMGGGTVITASITNEAVEELRLAKGDAISDSAWPAAASCSVSSNAS